MEARASSDEDEGAVSRWFDFDTRRELVGVLSRQIGMSALCLDETITLCPLTREILELDLAAFGDDGDGRFVPLSLLRESDQPAVLRAVMRARSHGVADEVVHRDGCDEEVVVHVVNMLDEWDVLVVLVGGKLRPLLEHDAGGSAAALPRRLVHHRDRTGHLVWVDDATELLLGWSRAEMLGESAIKFVDPADHERAMAGWIDMLAGGRAQRSRIRYLTAAGDRRWLEANLTNLLADSEAGYVEVELIDVHDEMMALSAAKFGEAQFDALTESLPVGVIQVGADGEVVYVNRWMRDLTDVIAPGASCREGVVANDREIVDHAFDAAISNGASTNVDARLISASNGQHRHCRLRIRPLGVDEDGGSLGAIASIEDITETRALHARLYTQIRTDALTSIPNRLALNEWLDQHLVEGVGGGITLLYFDLDGFKDVNDRLGHEAGDRLLRAISMAVDLAIEPDDLIARIGGDEFVVARPRLIDDQQCALLAQHLLDTLDCDIDLGGATVKVGCSIGIARTQMPNAGPLVLADADRAMYHAKRNGGQRWTIHSEALRTHPGGNTSPATPSAPVHPWCTPTVTAPIATSTTEQSAIAAGRHTNGRRGPLDG